MVGREQVDLVTSTSILMISSKDLMRHSVAFLVIDTLCILSLLVFSAFCNFERSGCTESIYKLKEYSLSWRKYG